MPHKKYVTMADRAAGIPLTNPTTIQNLDDRAQALTTGLYKPPQEHTAHQAALAIITTMGKAPLKDKANILQMLGLITTDQPQEQPCDA